MAFTIGICDDSHEQVQLLTQYLNSYRNGSGFTIIKATGPEDFLEKLQTCRPQLVFLDIAMGGMNGIQLGEKIRALYEDTIVIYITAHENYALEAFGVRAFHYLLKPLTKEKFSRVFEEAIGFIGNNSEKKPEKTFAVQLKGEIICLIYSDIYYFEKISHRVKVHTAERDIYFYDSISNILGRIDSDSFIQCHQGYIVNIDKIRSFRDKTLTLDGNIKLPVSRSYTENIKEVLAKRLFAGKGER